MGEQSYFGDDKNPVNWNAGQEFNLIVGELKTKFITAMLIRDYDACIELLGIDIDLSYSKIIEEAIRRKEDITPLEKEKKVIEDEIKEAREFNKQKETPQWNQHLYKNYEYEMKLMLEKIRRKIWGLQGKYGVLYPQIMNKPKDPRKAMRDGFR
jgi:hypothetical protein